MNYSRINQKFFGEYLELDKLLCERFGTKSGVTEYINKLTNANGAHGREKLLRKLIKYRGLRNRIAHEPGALKSIDSIKKEDVSWIKSFKKTAKKGKDPLAVYLKSASGRAGSAALKKTLALAAVVAVVAAVALIIILL